MNIFDIFFVVFIQLLVLSSINYFSKDAGIKNRQPLYYLWLYHMIFCLIFWYYVNHYGGDAIGYWKIQPSDFTQYFSKGPGTSFMFVLNYVFVVLLHLSFLTGSVIYAGIGFLGFLFFYIIVVKSIKKNVKLFGINLFPIIFYLPNLHFWSCGVGKDTLVFFGIGLFVFSTFNPLKRFPGLVISLMLIYFLRPHITIFLLISFGVGFLLDNKLNATSKIFFSICMLIGAALLFNNVMQFLKLDELSIEKIESFSNKKVETLSRETIGSSVNISSYSFPKKIFTFIYRPLFFDNTSITGLFASIENMLVLLLTLISIPYNPIKAFFKAPFQIKGLFIFFVIGAISFSNILGNFGIIMRMKNMLMPGLLIFIFWTYSYNKPEYLLKNIKNKKNKRSYNITSA